MRNGNILKKLISILCVAVMFFSVGCKTPSEGSSNNPTPTPNPEPGPVYTDGYIVDKNGVSAYKILTPEVMDGNLEIAVSEL